jgi:hypothetical protein
VLRLRVAGSDRSASVFSVVLSAVVGLAAISCRTNDMFPDLDPNRPSVPGEDPDGPPAGRGGSGGSRRGGSGGGAAAGGAAGAPVVPADVDASVTAGTTGGSDAEVIGGVDAGAPAPDPVPVDAGASTHGFRLDAIANWRGNAAGVYTILHEGVCDSAFLGSVNLAEPELTSRGLHGAFAVVAGACETGKLWPKVKAMVDHGHEVLNQTVTGSCLGKSAAICGAGVPRATDLGQEIDGASTTLMAKIGIKPTAFVFPYDVCDAPLLAYVRDRFLGAQCGNARINAANFADAVPFKFDLWGPAYSAFNKAAVCDGVTPATPPAKASAACRKHVLEAPVEEAIAKLGWVVRNFHGFVGDEGNFEPVAPADYRAHLDFVAGKVKDGLLWVAGPSDVIRYRFARQACALPAVAGATLTFATPSADCSKYATGLSYLVSVTDGSDPATLAALQGGQRVAARKLGPGKFVVDADPTRGDALIVE